MNRPMKRGISRAAAAALLFSLVAADEKPADLSNIKDNSPVQVREGDAWSKATLIKREGRRFQVRYDDGTEEWVEADRIRLDNGKSPEAPAGAPDPAKPPAPEKPASPEKPAAPEKPKYPSFASNTKVEVKWGGSWSPATVINRRGDWYMVEYERGSRREWVEPRRLRKPGDTYETANAHPNPSFGKGEIVAPPRPTPEDPKDQPKSNDNPKPGAPGEKPKPAQPAAPELKLTEAKRDAPELSPKVDWAVPSLTPPVSARIPSNVMATVLPSLEFGAGYDKLIVRGKYAMVTAQGNLGGGASGFVRADLMTGTSKGYELPARTEVLDISPNGLLVVTGSETRVDIFRLSIKTDHVIGFVPAEKQKVTDARFIDNQKVVVQTGYDVACWDTSNATKLWTIRGELSEARSPEGKVVTVKTAAGLAFVDAVEGKVVGLIPEKDLGTTSISWDGQVLASRSRDTLRMYNLQDGKQLSSMKMATAGSLGGKTMVAINKDFVLITGLLYSIPKQNYVWLYTGSVKLAVGGGRVFSICDDRESRRTVIASAELPHAAAKQAVEQAKPPTAVIGAGTSITLDIQPEGPEEKKQAVIKALTEKFAAAGVKIADNQPVRLIARTGPPEIERRLHETGTSVRDRTIEEVKVERKTTTLELQYEGKVIWSKASHSANDPGEIVILNAGQTVQDYVNSRGDTVNVDWMLTADIPTQLYTLTDYNTLPRSLWVAGGVKDIPPKEPAK